MNDKKKVGFSNIAILIIIKKPRVGEVCERYKSFLRHKSDNVSVNTTSTDVYQCSGNSSHLALLRSRQQV